MKNVNKKISGGLRIPAWFPFIVAISSLISITVSEKTIDVFFSIKIGVSTYSSAGVYLILNGINYFIAGMLFFFKELKQKNIGMIRKQFDILLQMTYMII